MPGFLVIPVLGADQLKTPGQGFGQAFFNKQGRRAGHNNFDARSPVPGRFERRRPIGNFLDFING